ncbi:hypothetical protein BDF20DRAFT_878877 [Mycotypha africana]|uniref:uncharacterized protein n=1 Tax=Mycotypha africana TaxID=64632 RepID=UPI002301B115|nr:uncharacterized protein BDF20DRAFT_878877 [Mycotypha africana]KAI8975472.1 hypothetical protein BDF20DRAFT_878877 [Mycotypha africana]
MSDNSESIAQFISMTNANEQQAKFYLEMSNGDLELAVTQFFDNSGSTEAITDHTTAAVPTDQRSASQQAFGGASGSNSNISRSTTPTNTGKPTSSSSSKIRSFSDLISSNDGGDSDDDDHENLYAGGEKSGMVVQGPNRRGGSDNGDNLVDEILRKAAQGGPVPAEEFEKSTKKPKYYTGTGYRLGSEEEPSSVVQPAETSAGSLDEEPEPVTRYLTFWRNGFSVDDGPLFEYNDPANQEMLTAINSGRAPLSLLNVRHGQPVEVRVVKRQGEDYVPPPKVRKAFEGAGNRLGSPAPTFSTPSPAPGAYPAAASNSNSSANTNAPTIDESQPITNIQIRLADGSRLIAKLNHTHTIADIRKFIESSRPTAGGQYILQTTFPVKELKDANQSVKDAGLLNSVVIQRYQ